METRPIQSSARRAGDCVPTCLTSSPDFFFGDIGGAVQLSRPKMKSMQKDVLHVSMRTQLFTCRNQFQVSVAVISLDAVLKQRTLVQVSPSSWMHASWTHVQLHIAWHDLSLKSPFESQNMKSQWRSVQTKIMFEDIRLRRIEKENRCLHFKKTKLLI